ncbi:FAD-dependent monooxygenase [Snodgrassella gandavensis]|uniref:FAD-dependent monooxygenase n=1 Tax=Snodgrassella gandavensis TaxID=2946698 RepID=UPI001EF57209|nr:FAD-dependent monooxygenase [Snodgrassella gandavensis]
MQPLSHYPFIIIGAGPVGMLAALKLQQQGKPVLLLEARAADSHLTDQRTLALSYHSIQAFRRAGVDLPDETFTFIQQVHVSRQQHFGRVLLTAQDINLPYLGATIDYARLLHACEKALQKYHVPVQWQTTVEQVQSTAHWASVQCIFQQQQHILTAQWLILAEGGNLAVSLPDIRVRSHDYRQQALVNTLKFESSNQSIAYERFTRNGPFALLPYGDDFRLVWTCTPEEAQQRQQQDVHAFNQQLQAVMGNRLGQLCQMGTPATFPLKLRQLNQVYSQRVICIGNAAQTMHPVAAQGLNLGVRDAETLSEILGNANPAALDNAALARKYAQTRAYDARAVVGFTHILVQLFDHAHSGLKYGQSLGMGILGAIPALRHQFTRQLVFGLNQHSSYLVK